MPRESLEASLATRKGGFHGLLISGSLIKGSLSSCKFLPNVMCLGLFPEFVNSWGREGEDVECEHLQVFPYKAGPRVGDRSSL